MHGAFGEDDRSSAKKYALFRMFMNFRQWMPEHYARRFRGRHYNAEIGMDREGYYVTVFNFVKDCIMGLKDNKYTIATRWNELDDMQKYNINRAISEVTMMAIMAALVFVLGLDGDDKKKNWAYS
jgi:hypothetical protein